MNNERLYTVNQIGAACGVSRATLLRLEEEGLLIPTIHETKRMYSFHDMMKLRQIVMLHNYGFTHAVIKKYFEDNGNYNDLLALLAAKQSDIFYFMSEMQIRMDHYDKINVQSIFAPEIPCHCMNLGTSFPYYAMHTDLISLQMEDVIAKKLEVSPSRPLFISTQWDDLAAGAEFGAAREFTGHIPLVEMPEQPDPAVMLIPRQRVLSVLYHGPTVPMNDIIREFKNKIEREHLTARGPLYLISMVGPHLGLDIPPERYLARVALPIEE